MQSEDHAIDPAPGPHPEAGETPRWDELGVDPTLVDAWKDIGFSAFQAALAQGDGFTPSFAVHYRHQLQQVAESWVGAGLGSAEGLRWHRAAFSAREAVTWRSQSVDVDTAQARRAGYDVGR
jgi:hypothetical protein